MLSSEHCFAHIRALYSSRASNAQPTSGRGQRFHRSVALRTFALHALIRALRPKSGPPNPPLSVGMACHVPTSGAPHPSVALPLSERSVSLGTATKARATLVPARYRKDHRLTRLHRSIDHPAIRIQASLCDSRTIGTANRLHLWREDHWLGKHHRLTDHPL